MKRNNQKGTAMLFAIILVLVLSVMAASMMFLSQSETWGSANYRMMTQARYGAEAGVHAAANFLLNTYAPPASTAGYNMVVPVPASCGDIACVTDGATNSSVTAGYTTVNYTAAATLLSQAQITQYGQTTPTMIQTWKITAHGDITNARSAEAEVSAILETPATPTFRYAAFAKNNGCAALGFTGNGGTDSYDSGALPANFPSGYTFGYGGNVGTNGNETDKGTKVVINGTLSTPDLGFGVCSAGNITALSANSSSQVTGGIVQLPAAFNPPTPTIPPSGPVPGSNISGTQILGAGLAPCPATMPKDPCNLGDIAPGNGTVTLQPGTYNINSISLSGLGQLVIVPDPITGLYGPVVINVTGANQTTPISLSGQGISNPTYDPSLMQFNYAGTGNINIVGQGASAAVIFAPNATASFKGNGSFYGSVIAAQLNDVGNGFIHYDLRLEKKLYFVGSPTLNSFTWSKF